MHLYSGSNFYTKIEFETLHADRKKLQRIFQFSLEQLLIKNDFTNC